MTSGTQWLTVGTVAARLDDMRMFATLAAAGSITGAARQLGMPKQTVSRRLAELERTLGVALARRTTRSMTLTDVGRAYASRCAEVVRLADDANRAVSSGIDAVAGTLRITADHTFGAAFLPGLVADYLAAWPDVEVEVWLTSRKLDLVREGIDVAFRVGPPPDVTYLAATRLGPARLSTVASPRYLARRPPPRALEELAEHDCLSAVPTHGQPRWPMRVDGALRLVDVQARLRVRLGQEPRHLAGPRSARRRGSTGARARGRAPRPPPGACPGDRARSARQGSAARARSPRAAARDAGTDRSSGP